MWKAKKKVIKLPKERWKTGLWIWICSLTESQKVIPLIKKKEKRKKKLVKKSVRSMFKNKLLRGYLVHVFKKICFVIWKYMWKYVSENVCGNMWYLKTKNVCLSGYTKHLLKEEKRKIVVLFGVGLSLRTNFYVFLGFICFVTIF